MGHDAGMHHDMHNMKPDVTRPQLAVVGLLTVLALVASVVIPAMFANLTYSAEEVGGAIMPPGMIMTRDTPAQPCARWRPSTRARSATPRPPTRVATSRSSRDREWGKGL